MSAAGALFGPRDREKSPTASSWRYGQQSSARMMRLPLPRPHTQFQLLTAAWCVSGWIVLFLGRPEEAIQDLQHAIDLNPYDRLVFKIHAAMAYATQRAIRSLQGSQGAAGQLFRGSRRTNRPAPVLATSIHYLQVLSAFKAVSADAFVE